jgi:hypothetical protein
MKRSAHLPMSAPPPVQLRLFLLFTTLRDTAYSLLFMVLGGEQRMSSSKLTAESFIHPL